MVAMVLTDREERVLGLYCRYEAAGGLTRGWKARAQRELGWGSGEFQRNYGLLVAQGLIVDENLWDDDIEPSQAEHCQFCQRRLRVYAAKRLKAARGSIYDLSGTGYSSPILTLAELDLVLGDREGGTSDCERDCRRGRQEATS
jgi:hypothetical protein